MIAPALMRGRERTRSLSKSLGGLTGSMSQSIGLANALNSPVALGLAMAAPVPGLTMGLLGARSLANQNVDRAFEAYSNSMHEKENFGKEKGFNSRTGSTADSRRAARTGNLGNRAGGAGSSGAGSGRGSGGGCFYAHAPVDMADGSTKPIADLRLGDETAGGEVTARYVFRATDQEWVKWRGIEVSSRHIVLEDGRWLHAGDSDEAEPIENTEDECYLVDVTSHRLPINGQIVQDYLAFIDSEEMLDLQYAFQLASYNQSEVRRGREKMAALDLPPFAG